MLKLMPQLIKKKREKIDERNQAETLIYQTEKQMKEIGDKVDDAAKAKVEEKKSSTTGCPSKR